MLETVFSIYLCLIQFSDGITYQNMISKAVNIETGSLPAAVQSMITSGPISTRSLIWVRNSFPKLVQMVLCKKEASNIFLILALTQIFPRPNSSVNQGVYLNKTNWKKPSHTRAVVSRSKAKAVWCLSLDWHHPHSGDNNISIEAKTPNSFRVIIRCGRVMAKNIAYAKFRKSLLIW